jgi:3-oxoacyl-[acyl-carrier protein] reductase
MKTIVVAGASRGIGAAVATAYNARAERLVAVSRTQALAGEWVKADLSQAEGAALVQQAVGDDTLDALLYMGGTWEAQAFTDEYRFEASSDDEIVNVLAVNLLAPIRLVKALLPALRRSNNPKIVLMGALSGLDNIPAREVANSASKFGLRGVVHALREELRNERIGVSVINAGNIGTPEVLQDLKMAAAPETDAIPLDDFLRVVDCIMSVSRAACVKEIDFPAMGGQG